jgi:DNA gyrase/topoisomerase IV subunit A
MSQPYEPQGQELEMAARRLDYLDAALRAAERRAEVSRVIGDAQDSDAARRALAELLAIPAERAEDVMDLRLRRLTQASVTEMRSERADIVARYGDPRD